MIAGIKVRPWSFGELFLVAGPLESVIDKIEESGMSHRIIGSQGELNFDYLSLAKLFTLASGELLQIISDTLHVEEEKIKALTAPEGIAIVLLMFNQNKEMLTSAVKNVFGSPQKETKLQKKMKTKKAGEPKKTIKK